VKKYRIVDWYHTDLNTGIVRYGDKQFQLPKHRCIVMDSDRGPTYMFTYSDGWRWCKVYHGIPLTANYYDSNRLGILTRLMVE
jgi:hypothetical protein